MEPCARSGIERAFSLIELLIVVAIIGILAAIAVPAFDSFVARSRQAEAKVALAATTRAQAAYRSAHDSFTDNLSNLQWAMSGQPVYLYGFASDGLPAASGCNDSAECGSGYSRARMTDIFGVPLTEGDLPATAVVTQHGYTVAAVGNLDSDAALDSWTLNDSNILTNVEADIE